MENNEITASRIQEFSTHVTMNKLLINNGLVFLGLKKYFILLFVHEIWVKFISNQFFQAI